MYIPDTQHNLESLLLGCGNDVLGGVAVARRVRADQRRQVLQRVKVFQVVVGGLAAAVGVLVTQRETQQTTVLVQGSSGQRGQQKREQSRNTHIDSVELSPLKSE